MLHEQRILDKLQALRTHIDRPFYITSGYRSPTHPIEVRKRRPGEHSTGRAADIACRGDLAYNIIKAATLFGFTRIGVKQSGSGRFLHLGTSTEAQGYPSPTVWSY